MSRSIVVKSKRNQAVRVPRAIASLEDVRQIDAIPPVGRGWCDFFPNGPRASEDFMTDREQARCGGARAALNVIPAKAGIHRSGCGTVEGWIPAFAGMTFFFQSTIRQRNVSPARNGATAS